MMDKTRTEFYIQELCKLREEAKINVLDKDELYTSFMVNLNQCITFCHADIQRQEIIKHG